MTPTSICNKALSMLGEASIADLSETSVLAEKCRNHYDVEHDALLRMHRWNFAKQRVDLVATDPAPTFGWDYRYDLPDDCLRVLSVNGVEADLDECDFEIEGRSLLSDDYGVSLVYIRRIPEDETDIHDPLFNLAFAAKLAAALCLELTSSQQKKESILAEFGALMREAGWVDAVEDKCRVIPATSGSRTIMARLGYSSRNTSY